MWGLMDGTSWMVQITLNPCSLCLQALTFPKNDSLDKGNARPLQHGVPSRDL